jgi:hypothetical protein
MAKKIQFVVFWVMTPHSDLAYWSFGGPCCFHLWGEDGGMWMVFSTLQYGVTTQKTMTYLFTV